MERNTKVAFRFAGLSGDGRANRWTVTCGKCGKDFNPPTTMLATQSFECKCGAQHYADWNRDHVVYMPPENH